PPALPGFPGFPVVGVSRLVAAGTKGRGKAPAAETASATRLSGLSGCRGFAVGCGGDEGGGKGPAAKTASATRVFGCRGFRGWLRRGRSGEERRRRRRPPALPGFPVVGVFAVGCGGDEVERKGAGGEDRQRYQAFRFARVFAVGCGGGGGEGKAP